MRACAIAALALTASNVTAADSTFESFYVARTHVTDAVGIGDRYTIIVDATPIGGDVRVRVIRRIFDPSDACQGQVVDAIERIVPHTTIGALAGRDLCALNPSAVDAAFAAARKRDVVVLAGEFTTAVATCGGRERVFETPIDETIDWQRVERTSVDARLVARLFERVTTKALGDQVWFNPDNAQEAARQATLGDDLIPYLTSGRFAALRGWDAASLGDAAARRHRHIAVEPGVLVERADYALTAYQPVPGAPAAPRVGEGARDVQVRLTVDRATGAVVRASVVSGAFISPDTRFLMREWRFVPGSVPADEIVVTLRFNARCE